MALQHRILICLKVVKRIAFFIFFNCFWCFPYHSQTLEIVLELIAMKKFSK